MPPFRETVFDRTDWKAQIVPLLVRCRPRILIVTDGALNFLNVDDFGLTRFIEAITQHPSVTLSPSITLGHRGASSTPVTIGTQSFPVQQNFVFGPTVTTANFDQIWMFGVDSTHPGLGNGEVGIIADFMNAGGGVFSTGDHATLGKAMGGRLPRIRHMREWTNVPMGDEPLPGVRQRIDTVVNPGADQLYEFKDQSDDIPQRIYPNYIVTGTNPGWTATVHRLLRLPGAPVNRTVPADFTQDIDVMPDHPHESECYEISSTVRAALLTGSYTEASKNFAEFPFANGSTTVRVGSDAVAFAVSGGRAIIRSSILKPPVTPRMFTILAAFDGHAATPYTAQGPRPGRIVVDSTWHHYVNINLDGTQSGRTGLGIGAGAAFVPSPDLLKIYRLYQNTVDWLQPAARIWCNRFIDLIAVRFDGRIRELLAIPPQPGDPRSVMTIGNEAFEVFVENNGPDAALELVATALRTHPKAARLADVLTVEGAGDVQNKVHAVVVNALGQAVIALARALPDESVDAIAKTLKRGHEKLEAATMEAVVAGVVEGLDIQAARSKAQVERLNVLRKATLI